MGEKNEWCARLLLRCTRAPAAPALPTAMTRLTENVYLGSAADARAAVRGEAAVAFKCLVNMTTSAYEVPGGITVFHVPLRDDSATDITPIIPPLVQLLERLDKDGSPTLVHCVAGVNRSGAAAMAYLMHRKCADTPGMTAAAKFVFFLRTYYELRDARGAFLENASFRSQVIRMFVTGA
nr:MAG: putative protein-tyrosine phosphatase [Equine parapoxvirus]